MCKDDTHPSAVDSVVNTSKLLDGCFDETLHAAFITYIELDSKDLVIRVPSNALALLGNFLGAFMINVCEDNTLCPSFRISERGFFADAGCGLWMSVLARSYDKGNCWIRMRM